ncbi:M20/M25/M40 family metallo-hydrolase [Salicibibacter cibi]|uniref:M20/M25/M40 family metallo-hydrolase n=1 Tax=Salicibibacter cibi TaxID=2743001 RepID=A0A7T7CGD2_9BACI|nr:M28 family peptidase [Salicibibacter cibi]QQK81048.1 M20/M25/M40 family metallo-hydrolase [Salicibibacter cibi]
MFTTEELLDSESWSEAQQAMKQLFEVEGFQTYFNEVGNLFVRLKGSENKKETILTGSHVDTVKSGGYYDRQLGVLGGYLAVKYLKETYGQPVRNIEVFYLAEEEGSRFPFCMWGSKYIAGQVTLVPTHFLVQHVIQ